MWSQCPWVSRTRAHRAAGTARAGARARWRRRAAPHRPVSGAAQDEHVVVDRPDHHLVDLHPVASQISVSGSMLTSVCAGCGGSTRSTGASSPSRSRRSARCWSSRSTCSPTRPWSAASAPRRSAGWRPASTVLNTLVWVFNFLSYGTTVRVAVRRGRGDLAGRRPTRCRRCGWRWASGLAVAVGIGLAAGVAGRAARRRPRGDRAGRDLPAVSAVGIPFQMVAIAASATSTASPTRSARSSVLLFARPEPGPRARAGVRARLGHRGQRWGTVMAQILSAIVFLSIVVPSLRADGLHHLQVVPR